MSLLTTLLPCVGSGDLPPGSVDNSELAVMPAETIKANPTAGILNPQDITVSDLNTLLNSVLRSGSSMDAAANLTFSGGGEVFGLPGVPSVGNAATSKDYVDSVANGLSWQVPVLDKDLATPPGAPTTGDRYIVATGGTGAWSGHDDDIATFDGSVWQFITPSEGFANWVEDEDKNYVFTTVWIKLGSTVDHGNLIGLSDDDHLQYHTDARALTWLGTRSTSDLSEGSNLYYTEGRVSANTDVAANTSDRHTHANKANLDTINQDLATSNSPLFAGINLRDTDDSHSLFILLNEDFSANSTLSLIVGDASRTLTLTGDPTLADWFNQSVKTNAAPLFAGLSVTGISAQENEALIKIKDTRPSSGAFINTVVSVNRQNTNLPGLEFGSDATDTPVLVANGKGLRFMERSGIVFKDLFVIKAINLFSARSFTVFDGDSATEALFSVLGTDSGNRHWRFESGNDFRIKIGAGTLTGNGKSFIIFQDDNPTADIEIFKVTGSDTGAVKAETSGDFLFNTLAKNIQIKGSNSVTTNTTARMGRSTLVAGTVTITNSNITANTFIFVSVETLAGTTGPIETSTSVGNSFTISSASASDTSTVAWMLVDVIL